MHKKEGVVMYVLRYYVCVCVNLPGLGVSRGCSEAGRAGPEARKKNTIRREREKARYKKTTIK